MGERERERERERDEKEWKESWTRNKSHLMFEYLLKIDKRYINNEKQNPGR